MRSVLVSTHDLPAAGRLREAFRALGYRVDLVTPSEDLSEAKDPELLVVTGGVRESAALVRQAEALDLSGLIVSQEEEVPPQELGGGIMDTFGPGTSAEDVAVVGHRIVERRRLQQETGIIGETEAMREVLERVVQIAPVVSTVLITGESGTGKELVARGLHALSPRRHKPFIAVNVAALPDTLLESELFGHEKGAFTGAVDSRRGLFELAHRGTIFLDEIGEMPPVTQTKLLRVLEQREFFRVGGEESIEVDVRIITATNQDLRQLVALREFRRDLYYRINVLSIHLPSLRERSEDIPLLVKEFVREASLRNERPFPGITPAAMDILESTTGRAMCVSSGIWWRAWWYSHRGTRSFRPISRPRCGVLAGGSCLRSSPGQSREARGLNSSSFFVRWWRCVLIWMSCGASSRPIARTSRCVRLRVPYRSRCASRQYQNSLLRMVTDAHPRRTSPGWWCTGAA